MHKHQSLPMQNSAEDDAADTQHCVVTSAVPLESHGFVMAA